eukprot:TRINITY_DN2070_c1_g1_i1.p1 TRINITY_DN2070_c1_g1~~TRINITY_DN2070_c1_g1_i1.p1  ORF type:complete len:320 (-),score=46.54 TRINITY_DN2070_c1_g1_i1:138-1097(-)
MFSSEGSGGHGHSHGGDSSDHGHDGGHGHGHSRANGHNSGKSHILDDIHVSHSESSSSSSNDEFHSSLIQKKEKGPDDNIRAVFLHVLGDFLGSIAAIASGLLIHFLEFKERYYFDPVLSLLIVIIILIPTIPLVRKTIRVLMQSTPPSVDTDKLTAELITVPGVVSVHELHIWTLTGNTTIGSLHVLCFDVSSVSFMEVARRMKVILHAHGVHSSTIQSEFVSVKNLQKKRKACVLACDSECLAISKACCPPGTAAAMDPDDLQTILHRSGSVATVRRRSESTSFSGLSHQDPSHGSSTHSHSNTRSQPPSQQKRQYL